MELPPILIDMGAMGRNDDELLMIYYDRNTLKHKVPVEQIFEKK